MPILREFDCRRHLAALDKFRHGKRLNWKPSTIARMEQHRRKWNQKSRKRIANAKG